MLSPYFTIYLLLAPLSSQATLDDRSWKVGGYVLDSRSMGGTFSRNKIVIR